MQDKKLFFSSDNPNAEGLSGLKPHANLPFLLEGDEGRRDLRDGLLLRPT